MTLGDVYSLPLRADRLIISKLTDFHSVGSYHTPHRAASPTYVDKFIKSTKLDAGSFPKSVLTALLWQPAAITTTNTDRRAKLNSEQDSLKGSQ